jgi:hypothetical protein
VARIYDYVLGGSHNFAVDRETAHKILAVMPDAAMVAQANRAFPHRAVRFLIGAGVRQLLDIGSGIPTLGNVHEIARKAAPEARVAYIDIDPVAQPLGVLLVAVLNAIPDADDPFGIVARHPDSPDDVADRPELSSIHVGVGRKR